MSILEAVEKHVREEYQKDIWDQFAYHNLNHTLLVVRLCEEMATAMSIPEKEREALLIAAWFHDLGYAISYTDHEQESKKLARSFLDNLDCSTETTELVLDLIESTRIDIIHFNNRLEKIIHDADHGSIGRPDFFKVGNRLRVEWEIHDFAVFQDNGWFDLQVRYILNTTFQTDYYNKQYGSQRLVNLEIARQKAQNV